MSPHVFNCHDLDEVTFEHPIEDLKREIGDESMAHAKLARDRSQQRPADRMGDDILNGFVDCVRKPLAKAFALVFVLAGGGPELDARGSKDPMRAFTGHATGSAATRPSARREPHPKASNRARRRRPPRCAA